MSCNNCFTDWICKCVPYDNFIQLNIPALTGPAFYRVRDSKGNEVSGEVTAEGHILLIDFPDGFFSPFGGPYTIELFESEDQCVKIPMYLAKYYDCIELDVRNVNQEKNTIGCL